MGFFFWSRRKSQPAPIKDAGLFSMISDPFISTKGSQPAQNAEDEDLSSMPGAFPPSPPLSPRLAPLEREESVPVSEFERMDIDVAASPELPTELGSHLHPRRPLSFTPKPKRTRPAPSAPRTPIRQPALQDEMLIDDPWNQQSLIFERLPFGRPVSAVQIFTPTPRPLPANRTVSIYAPDWEKIERERAALEREQLRPARTIPPGPPVRQLPWEWVNRISRAMRTSAGQAVARSLSGDDLYQKDIATCIEPLAWLNDEIINSYLTVIIRYLRHSSDNLKDRPRFHAFNSFFYSSLRDKGYQAVRRWANRAKIGGEALLDVDTIFIPVHESAHWTLMVVWPADRTIEYFDSLGGRGGRQVKVIKQWLRGELGAKYDDEEWTFLPSVSSHQDNGSDCGVFLLTNAKAIALGIEPTAFGAEDTTLLRRKIVAELMNEGLHGEFSPIDDTGLPSL